MITGYEVVQILLHLVEIESAIDSLSYRLTSLKYSTDAEMAEPKIVMGSNFVQNNEGKFLVGGKPITIFSRIMNMHDAFTVCQKLGMRVIELDNLPHQIRVPEILLHFEILVTNGNIICTSATISKKGPDCVQYILSFTKHRNFIRTASELTKTLLAYKNNKFFMKATETSFLFTTASYGVSGCEGDLHSADKSRDFQKDLHSRYFRSLGGLYISLYANLNNYVEYISESVHQLSADSSMIPISLVNNSMIMKRIIEFLPSYIPALDVLKMKFSEFTVYFNSEITESNDDIIDQFRNVEFLSQFNTRQLKRIYSASEQFYVNTKIRISKFALHFVDRRGLKKIPNTWLITEIRT
jgi:hypothetical protein